MAMKIFRYIYCLSLMVLGVGLLQTTDLRAEGDVSEEKIFKKLQHKKYLTRNLDLKSLANEKKKDVLINKLSHKKSRGLKITVEERTEIHTMIKSQELPTIDLVIYFEFNSDKVTQDSLPTLVKLGKVLSRKELKGATIMVAGHTDAKGSAGYNQDLSRRRAETVKQFLAKSFDLEGDKLIAVGFGKEYLKKGIDPLSGENRRVQVTNLKQ